MMPSRLSAGIYVLLVFSSGVLVGAFGHRLYTSNAVRANTTASRPPRNPENLRKKYIQDARTRLSLTDQQVTQLQAILDQTRQKFHELHERTQPQLQAIRDQEQEIRNQHVESVMTILNDQQKEQYAAWRAEREKRRQQSNRH